MFPTGRKEEKDMTNTFKRQIYRFCIVSAACFFGAFLLYDLQDIGIASDRLIFPCFVLMMVGVLFAFKALDTWSSWNEDNSEDIGQIASNAYPITFYTEAALLTLSVIFLLVFTIIRSRPTIEEEGVLAIALFVAGACACLGSLSSNLE